MADEMITEKAPESPAAFPVSMTLRDYFAAQVLTGVSMPPSGSPEAVARAAYLIADAMLRERSK